MVKSLVASQDLAALALIAYEENCDEMERLLQDDWPKQVEWDSCGLYLFLSLSLYIYIHMTYVHT